MKAIDCRANPSNREGGRAADEARGTSPPQRYSLSVSVSPLKSTEPSLSNSLNALLCGNSEDFERELTPR